MALGRGGQAKRGASLIKDNKHGLQEDVSEDLKFVALVRLDSSEAHYISMLVRTEGK